MAVAYFAQSAEPDALRNKKANNKEARRIYYEWTQVFEGHWHSDDHCRCIFHHNMDVYLEVSDEIAGQLDRFKLDEEAHRVRILRAKAYFSLNRGDGIEKDALQKPPQPLELLLKAEQAERLNAALRSLSERQRRRLLAFYLDGKSKSQIAKEENVSEGSIRESIRSGLAQLKKSLKNF